MIQELEAADLLEQIEESVRQRQFGFVTRLTVSPEMPAHVLDLLIANLEVDRGDVYVLPPPLALSHLMTLYGVDRHDLKDPPFLPSVAPALETAGGKAAPFAAILIEIVVGPSAGIISALKQYSFWDVFVTLTTSILVSLPVFWLGLLLQYTFGIWLKNATNGAFYLPISGASGPPFPDFAYLILPAITLASVSTAFRTLVNRRIVEVSASDTLRRHAAVME